LRSEDFEKPPEAEARCRDVAIVVHCYIAFMLD